MKIGSGMSASSSPPAVPGSLLVAATSGKESSQHKLEPRWLRKSQLPNPPTSQRQSSRCPVRVAHPSSRRQFAANPRSTSRHQIKVQIAQSTMPSSSSHILPSQRRSQVPVPCPKTSLLKPGESGAWRCLLPPASTPFNYFDPLETYLVAPFGSLPIPNNFCVFGSYSHARTFMHV